MPRYFFHTRTASKVADPDGVDLADHVAARHEAIRASGELMRDGAADFWGTRPWLVTVTDEAGLILYEIEMHGRASPACAKEPTLAG